LCRYVASSNIEDKSAQNEFDFEVKGFSFSKDVLEDIFSKDVLSEFC